MKRRASLDLSFVGYDLVQAPGFGRRVNILST